MGKLRGRQVHLDFHTSEKIPSVGGEFNPGEFVKILRDAAVDSITCFAKCHHGMIYYDTSFTAGHPGLKRDLLDEQIKACHSAGIRVPIYISAGWDEYMAKRHPEWLERKPDGSVNGAGPLEAGWRKLCFNTAYTDYLSKQTEEVLHKFGNDVDGIFFDIVFQGECCCERCMEGMLKKNLDPEKGQDRIYYSGLVILELKKRLTGIIRKYNRRCSIFYNSGYIDPGIRKSLEYYTHLELESLPSGFWGYDHFPVTVRYAKNLGLEYLGMTGRFHKSWADFGGFKNQAALEYECFSALANGGGCSIGDQLHPGGKLNKYTYDLIGRVYMQVKEKEEWCIDAEPVSEIAVFTGDELTIDAGSRAGDPMAGAYKILKEGHHQFDIIDRESDLSMYRVVVLPDIVRLDGLLKEKFDSYIKNGGSVIASYESGMDVSGDDFVLDDLCVRYVRRADYSPDYFVAGSMIDKGLSDTEHVMYDRGVYVSAGEEAKVLARIWDPYFNRTYKHFNSHSQTPAEKESTYPAVVMGRKTVYFSHPVFAMYRKHGSRAYKQVVLNSLGLLMGDKLVSGDAPTTVCINLNLQRSKNRYVMHILHYIPERRCTQIDTIEDIIPLYDTVFQVKLPHRPVLCYAAPSMEDIYFNYDNGAAYFTVSKIEGHQMIVFEMG